MKSLMDAHPGRIRLSLRYAPFHRGSDEVVKMLEAARRQGKYRAALEAVLAAQPRWVVNHAARAELAWPALEGLGLDLARLKGRPLPRFGYEELKTLVERALREAYG